MSHISQLLTRIVPDKWLNINQCYLCLASCHNPALCPQCMDSLCRPLNPCSLCGISQAEAHPVCPRCTQNPPPFDACIPGLLYQSPTDHLIRQIKFHHNLALARSLGQWYAAHLRKHVTHLPDLIVPVPLHTQRLRERGFNQAVAISQPVSRLLSRPLQTRACVRRLNTAPQSGLDAQTRTKNLKNAFKVDSSAFRSRSVAIVDDVMTTTATSRALAKVLREAGASHIQIWPLSRAEKD